MMREQGQSVVDVGDQQQSIETGDYRKRIIRKNSFMNGRKQIRRFLIHQSTGQRSRRHGLVRSPNKTPDSLCVRAGLPP